MARAPKSSSPPASGWKAGHRAPGQVTDAFGTRGGFYGQLDGVCLENTTELDAVSDYEKRSFPGDCPAPEGY